jgi:hypothetical protein
MGLVAAFCSRPSVVLRFWITSDSGRAFITSQIDGRKLGPLGTVRISGPQGRSARRGNIRRHRTGR